METAKDILEKHFGNEGYSFERWSKDVAGDGPNKTNAILASLQEIADKAWEAGRNREHERWTAFPGQPKFHNKETFMKSLFPLKEI